MGRNPADSVALPGHTKGSVGLLVQEEKILIAGDALNESLWLFNYGSLPMRELYETLQRAVHMEFFTYLCVQLDLKHTAAVTGIRAETQISCLRRIKCCETRSAGTCLKEAQTVKGRCRPFINTCPCSVIRGFPLSPLQFPKTFLLYSHVYHRYS